MMVRATPDPLGNEEITINLSRVDRGRSDLLVPKGLPANRSGSIRTALGNHPAADSDAEARPVERPAPEMGLCDVTRATPGEAGARGRTLHSEVVGLARPAADITPDLARAMVGSITVPGALQAPAGVKAALKDRIR